MKWWQTAQWCAVALAATGCAGGTGTGAWEAPGYYWQSVNGHLALMRAARPVDDWLADATVNPALKDRLALAQRMGLEVLWMLRRGNGLVTLGLGRFGSGAPASGV